MKRILAASAACVILASCVSMQGRIPETGGKVSVKEPVEKRQKSTESAAARESEEKGIINVDVLIGKSSKFIAITSENELKPSLPSVETAREISVSAEDGTLTVNGDRTGVKAVRFSSAGKISYGGKKYRGDMTFKADGGTVYLINNVTLEQYLYGVMPSEISPSWHEECLKAQAVAARSFALFKRLNNKSPLYDLDSTVISQVYKGYDVEDARTNKAVDATEGRVMTYDNKVIEAFFHANSGGRTEEAKYVWGGNPPYLKSVDDPYCSDGRHYTWELKMSAHDIKSRLDAKGIRAGELYDIKPQDRSSSGRIISVKVFGSSGTPDVKGKDFREYIGVDKIRSTNFEVSRQGSDFVFRGHGWGHGVGMSQEGAKGYAEQGRGYKDILQHYYPGVEIKKMQVN